MRRARVESGDDIVVGVNAFQSSEENPLLADLDTAVQSVDPAVEQQAIDALITWRAERDQSAVDESLARLAAEAATEVNLMEATLACARAGVTTGEWAGTLRQVFGEYRAPTGISAALTSPPSSEALAEVRAEVQAAASAKGAPLRFLVGKPGLDGHSNGAEQIAVRARDAGFEVIYQGIRLTPEQIVAAAIAEDVDVIGLSILSGSHRALVPDVLEGLAAAGVVDIPVVVGGIIPEADAAWLKSKGVAAIFTPKDYDATVIMRKVLQVILDSSAAHAG
jgi:(2R)-ethylmalonyl-CoA mutase